jgi:hypothetical protein
MRTALRSFKEDEALLAHSFDQLLGYTATIRMINANTLAARRWVTRDY